MQKSKFLKKFILAAALFCAILCASNEAYALRIPIGLYERIQELARIQQLSEIIKDARAKTNNLADLGAWLYHRHGLRTLKYAPHGKKIILVTQDNRYVVKINYDKDGRAYYKEKAFFSNGHNPLPETKLLHSNDDLRVLIFDNALYNSGYILLFDYLHTPGISAVQIEQAMRSYAKVCASIHQQKVYDYNAAIYQDESLIERRKRLSQRLVFLRNRGYQNLPSLDSFIDAENHVSDTEIVLNHGDFSPLNIFVTPFTGESQALIDAEASSPGTRSKELAKIIIALTDARKNNSDLIKYFNKTLAAFFDEYFKISGANREKVLKSIPYYMATELLWYAQDTEEIFQNSAWVNWRLELCSWALSQSEFDIEKFINFLEGEAINNRIKLGGVSDFKMYAPRYSGAGVGAKTTALIGERVYFEITVPLERKFQRTVSAFNIAAEFWTDANSGIWHSAGPLEVLGFDGENAYMKGYLTMTEASGVDTPYGITARFGITATSRQKDPEWEYVEPRFAKANVAVIPGPIDQATMDAWTKFLSNTYGAMMFDFDGNLRFYNQTVPLEIYDLIIERLSKGIPFAMCTSRKDKNQIDNQEIIGFLSYIKERASYLGLSIDLRNVHVYTRNGKYGYNYGTGNAYYEILLEEASRKASEELIQRREFSGFIKENTYSKDESGLYFILRGGIDRALFAKKLNEELQKTNQNLHQKLIALYTEDFFEICPEEGTKGTALDDFSTRTGIEIEHILRTGDQGQLFGIDWPMLNKPGGASTYHTTPGSIYPLNIPIMAGKRSVDGNIYVLKMLNMVPMSRDLPIETRRSATATQL